MSASLERLGEVLELPALLVREEELADGAHAHRVAADAPVLGEAGDLGLDRREDPGRLAGRAQEVLGREDPEREGRGRKWS